MAKKILVMLPTYNEKDNVKKMCAEILATGVSLDVLFVDDNSPDGTGKILDRLSKEMPNVFVMHRAGKMGIGSAHDAGIRWAYKNGYTHLITMDSDFTHSPDNIPILLTQGNEYDVIVGSRFIFKNSLEGWNIWRRILTKTGHQLTKILLKVPYDATGAFRLYHIDRIPISLFDIIRSKGYSYFFESLGIMNLNEFKILEMPIKLPPRTYGTSKLAFRDMVQCLIFMIELGYDIRFKTKKLLIKNFKKLEIA